MVHSVRFRKTPTGWVIISRCTLDGSTVPEIDSREHVYTARIKGASNEFVASSYNETMLTGFMMALDFLNDRAKLPSMN